MQEMAKFTKPLKLALKLGLPKILLIKQRLIVGFMTMTL
jgi:hypothetical protein